MGSKGDNVHHPKVGVRVVSLGMPLMWLVMHRSLHNIINELPFTPLSGGNTGSDGLVC